jgi:hypothetical protein
MILIKKVNKKYNKKENKIKLKMILIKIKKHKREHAIGARP